MRKILTRDPKNPYPIHKLAGLVPMATESEQIALTEDIRMNGLREPIVLYHGKIVDGRCRQIACTITGDLIRAIALDDETEENDVIGLVKSLNTRRNLTLTQKVISACRVSLDPANTHKLQELATAWGVGVNIIKNARFIYRERPSFIQPLFDGKAVTIIGKDGKETKTNRISAIFSYLKRAKEQVTEDTQHGWEPDSAIKTQDGKSWYYKQVAIADEVGDEKYKMLVAELANYKFATGDVADASQTND